MTACPNPFRQALDRAAALVARMRPDWRDAETFYARRSEAIAAIRAAATTDRCDRCEAPALRERLARAHALLRASAAEAAHLRHLLASAARPKLRHRRAGPDPRQAALPLARGRGAADKPMT